VRRWSRPFFDRAVNHGLRLQKESRRLFDLFLRNGCPDFFDDGAQRSSGRMIGLFKQLILPISFDGTAMTPGT